MPSLRAMCAASVHMKFLHDVGEVESKKKTFRTTTYPASKDNGGQQHVVEAEDERRHVSHRSASPVRTVRLGLSNLTFSHDDLNIHHTMHKVMTLEYAPFVARCGTLSLASGQVMNLIGNRRRPKRTQRFIGANAGSPTGRESYGDGTPVVPEKENNDVSVQGRGNLRNQVRAC